jgi:hypothetical protein
MRKPYAMLRNGKKISVLPMEKDSEGYLWYTAGKQSPLINGGMIEAAGLTRAKLDDILRQKNWAALPKSLLCREGKNSTGLIIEDYVSIHASV